MKSYTAVATMSLLIRTISITVMGIAVAFASMPINAADNDLIVGLTPVADEELDRLRGGFVTADGLKINIGYEQTTFINGVLQTEIAVNLSNLERTGGSLNIPVNLVQNGASNLVANDVLDRLGESAFTVIQNRLDEQVLKNLNIINITIENVSSFKPMSIGRLVDHQLADTLR